MNYIAEIKAFYDLVQMKQLSTGQIALWHALMHINNKCAWAEWFTAPNLTLQLHTGLSRQGIINSRNTLKQLGLIDFKTQGTNSTAYKLNTISKSVQDTLQDTLQDSLQDALQECLQDRVQDTLQNSSALNKQNETKLNETKKNKKKKYGEFKNVLLSDDELQKLKDQFPDWENRIESMSRGIEMKGYKYKNHYLAILNWARRDAEKKPQKIDYSNQELF